VMLLPCFAIYNNSARRTGPCEQHNATCLAERTSPLPTAPTTSLHQHLMPCAYHTHCMSHQVRCTLSCKAQQPLSAGLHTVSLA
jgi:hypothetical protein